MAFSISSSFNSGHSHLESGIASRFKSISSCTIFDFGNSVSKKASHFSSNRDAVFSWPSFEYCISGIFIDCWSFVYRKAVYISFP